MKNWTLWIAVITALVFIACGGGAGSSKGGSGPTNNDPWSITIVGKPTPQDGSEIQEGDPLLYTIDYASGDVPLNRHAGVAIVAETGDLEHPIVLIASEEIAPNSKKEITLTGSVDLDKLQGAVYSYRFVAVIAVSNVADPDPMNSGDWDIQKRSATLTYYATTKPGQKRWSKEDAEVSSILQIASDEDHLYTLSPMEETAGVLKVWNVVDNGASFSNSVTLDFSPTCLAQDTDSLYIGGTKSGMGGEATWEIRKYDKVSLEAAPNWPSMPSGSVTAIEVSLGFVYAAGSSGYIERRGTDGNFVKATTLEGLNITDLAVQPLMDGSSAIYLVGSKVDSHWTIHKLNGLTLADIDEDLFPIAEPSVGLSTHVAVDLSNVYILGTTNEGQLRLERRTSLGDLVEKEFGDGGVITIDGANTPSGLILDENSLYLAGSTTEPSDDTKLWVQKRNLSNGSLDPSFGAAGTAEDNPSDKQDMALCLALGANSLYVGGVTGQIGAGGGQGYLLALNK